ncbi:hypothetical protein KVP02_07880, partial [Halobacterium salinarum]|uniref:hypothetical protein n=1 Tax=Halobacterium salinarum TaxID=2242 RepID=UPI001F3F8CC6
MASLLALVALVASMFMAFTAGAIGAELLFAPTVNAMNIDATSATSARSEAMNEIRLPVLGCSHESVRMDASIADATTPAIHSEPPAGAVLANVSAEHSCHVRRGATA